MMANGATHGLPPLWKATMLPVLAMSISAMLLTVLEPFVNVNLPANASDPTVLRSVVPVVSRMVVLIASWWALCDAVNVFMATTIIRAPYYFLLYLFYEVDILTVSILWLVDSTSSSLAFQLLGRGRREAAVARKYEATVHNRAIHNTSNELLLGALASTVWGFGLYALCVTVLPVWVIENFEDVPSVSRPHEANHLGMMALCLPMGFALRELLFTPYLRIDMHDLLPVPTFWGTSIRTVALFRRTHMLFLLMTFDSTVRAFLSLGGGSPRGAVLWALLWGALLYSSAFALSWAENGAEAGSPIRIEYELEEVEE